MGINRFEGIEIDKVGKRHEIRRDTCSNCGETLTLLHFNCCDHNIRGFLSNGEHKCEDRASIDR